METMKLLAWNLSDGLSDPERADALAEKIAEVQPDIAIFSEGAKEGRSVVASAKKFLELNVGNVYEADYDDFDNRRDRHRLVAVARPVYGEPQVLPNFGRNGFYFYPPKLELKIAGFHGFDRSHEDVFFSNEARIRQMRHAIGRMALDIDSQAIVLGDLNTIESDLLKAKIIRLASPLFNALPAKEPGESQSKLERVGSVTQRMGQMALGGSLRELHAAGFRDADHHHSPTMYIGPFGMQLDHIMGKRVELSRVELHDHHGLTDHLGVSAYANIFIRNSTRSLRL